MLAPAESSTMSLAEAVVALRGGYLEREDMLCLQAWTGAWVLDMRPAQRWLRCVTVMFGDQATRPRIGRPRRRWQGCAA